MKGRLLPIGNKNMSRLNRFLNGKGFYVALGICMIAIGVSAWSALDKVSAPPENLTDGNQSQVASKSASEETEANKEQGDIPDERESSSSKKDTAESKTSSSKAEIEQAPTAGYFVFPVVGEVIKKFSATELQYSVTFNDMRLHGGIDIKADEGTAVKSAGDGKVLEVVNDPQLGYTVKIAHGNGMVVVYAGLAKSTLVKADEIVKAGTNLGALGTVNNECLDAAHLHLEFIKDGKSVDPLEYLEK